MILEQKFLFELLSQPTAPYRESLVMESLTNYFVKNRVPFFRDPVGNMVVGVRNKREYLSRVKMKTKAPLRVFMAHSDHPGFHAVAWKSARLLEIKWFGGSPKKHLTGASVWLATKSGFQTKGVLKKAELNKQGTAIASGVVELPIGYGSIDPKELFGGFSFRKPIWCQGELIYTKAADDLIGCYAIASLAKACKKDPSFIGVLTRAEEVGFIGAIGHFELGWLAKARREVLCVSLETSRTLPGAFIGKGPVVRLGDRLTVFDPAGVNTLWEIAKRKLKGNFQRRIMDGGACEASAATAFGIRSIGISVPLGNYHNQSLQGGPDSRGPDGPAPEYVHLKDLKGMVTLCEALLHERVTFSNPWKKRRSEFTGWLSEAKPLLELR